MANRKSGDSVFRESTNAIVPDQYQVAFTTDEKRDINLRQYEVADPLPTDLREIPKLMIQHGPDDRSVTAAEQYKEASQQEARAGWDYCTDERITFTGRQVAKASPVIDDALIAKLRASETKLTKQWIANKCKAEFQKDYLLCLKGKDQEAIATRFFLDSNKTGLVHLSTIITKKKNQNMTEMAATYAEDRQIPYLLAAIALKALEDSYGFCYYVREGVDVDEIPWVPRKHIGKVAPP